MTPTKNHSRPKRPPRTGTTPLHEPCTNTGVGPIGWCVTIDGVAQGVRTDQVRQDMQECRFVTLYPSRRMAWVGAEDDREAKKAQGNGDHMANYEIKPIYAHGVTPRKEHR